jgi:hypothetical protein
MILAHAAAARNTSAVMVNKEFVVPNFVVRQLREVVDLAGREFRGSSSTNRYLSGTVFGTSTTAKYRKQGLIDPYNFTPE